MSRSSTKVAPPGKRPACRSPPARRRHRRRSSPPRSTTAFWRWPPTSRRSSRAAAAYGHIPGALNIDSAQFYDPANNRLKPKAELAAIASELPAGATVAYCNTGHWAATDWFVLHELLGRNNAKLFAGSMVEWTSNASRPIDSARTKWDDLKKKLGMGT